MLRRREKVPVEGDGQDQGCVRHRLCAVKSGTTEGVGKGRVGLWLLCVVWPTVAGRHPLTRTKNVPRLVGKMWRGQHRNGEKHPWGEQSRVSVTGGGKSASLFCPRRGELQSIWSAFR